MEAIPYVGLHNHTDRGSNIRLIDSTNKVDVLLQYGFDLGLGGMAITDHEALCSHVKAQNYVKAMRKKDEKWNNFKLVLGNEIYLCRNGLNGDNFKSREDSYYHFILLAKDRIGWEQLCELSTRAWMRSYVKFQRRVPTYYSDIEDIIGENPGHVIGSTACLGSLLDKKILAYGANSREKPKIQQEISRFLGWCQDIFGKDHFYLEMQPSYTEEQIFVNSELVKIGEAFDLPIIISTDSHYYSKEYREYHKAFLNSKDGEREVDDFYASTYVMDSKEIWEYMKGYLTEKQVKSYLENTIRIGEMCEDYDLDAQIKVPYIPQRTYKLSAAMSFPAEVPAMKDFINSPYQEDRDFAVRIMEEINGPRFYHKDGKEKMRLERIQTEMAVLWDSSEKQHIRWSAYLLQESDYVQIAWKYSLIGAARGSGAGFYLNYLLDIDQIDPTREIAPLKYWRFMNPERQSVLDIDVDVGGSCRDAVIAGLQEVYGKDRAVRVGTFMTEGARAAIACSARGLGIDVDVAQYLASMVTSERGIQHTLKQTFYGDEEKGLAPNKQFVKEMTENYPKLWEVAQALEGLVVSTSQHAGGVVIVDEPITKRAALMMTAKGEITTQFELHDLEQLGLIKIDMLAIEALDKIKACMDLLVYDGLIEKKPTLRETYENVLGIYKIDRTSPEMWKMLWENKIFSVFQMDAASGIQGIALTKPKSVEDLAALNSIIRLMGDGKGGEMPLQKYARFRDNPGAWDEEMIEAGLTSDERALLHKYLDSSNGICEAQERAMQLLLEPKIAGWTLGHSDAARKAIAKKKPKEFAELEKQFYENAKEKNLSKALTQYVWEKGIKCQAGYSFNLSHTISYSLIGLQEMNLAYHFPIIYWNCANMIVDSGSMNGMADEDDDEDDEDDDDTDTKQKTKSVDYGKISMAIGRMRNNGINVSLPDINKSRYSFTPDAQTNTILYGIKGITRIGDALVSAIIANRPYTSLMDFLNKVKVNKTQAINLIKSGAFDSLEHADRATVLHKYIESIADTKTRLTLQNMPTLIREGLIPPEMADYDELFRFNKYLKTCKSGMNYSLTQEAFDYYSKSFDTTKLIEVNGEFAIDQKMWDNIYKKAMEPMRVYLKDPKNHMLETLNNHLISQAAEKYAEGSVSKWEMDSVGFYYGQHELHDVYQSGYYDSFKIEDFSTLPENPMIDYVIHTKDGKEIPMYKLCFIAGTVINKNKLKHTVTLLTETGIVNMKIWDNQFVKYDKQISMKMPDGKKKIMERSWFTRGNKLLVQGMRRGNDFVPKKYKNSPNQFVFAKITEDGLVFERMNSEE